VDVGFSTNRATTAIALLDGDELHLVRAGTTWESRAAQIPGDYRASFIAIDGPLLPQGSDKWGGNLVPLGSAVPLIESLKSKTT
jgi:hypothetical protein